MTRYPGPPENSSGSVLPPPKPKKPPKGRPFEKGKSGNPGGRPKALKDVQDLAAGHTVESVEALVTIMRAGIRKPLSAQRMGQARQAAVAILDRAWGKPAQPISGVPGQPVELGGEAMIGILKKIAGEE